MLELNDVSLRIGPAEAGVELLSEISVRFPVSHFGAIIGPSGCGKTTLLKLIAGIAPGREMGEIRWHGRNLMHQDFHASEIAYLPQFGVAHKELTVQRSIGFALDLRVRGNRGNRKSNTLRLLEEVGLSGLQDRVVGTLSGGQRRRLALATELTNRPEILLCDEATSGLDPQAEDEIVKLLYGQSRRTGQLVLSVTHSLKHLEMYDSVLVLCHGHTAYHGPPAGLANYFGVNDPSDLYLAMSRKTPGEWAAAWKKLQINTLPVPAVVGPDSHPARTPACTFPSPLSQFQTLLVRRCAIFFHSRPQVLLQFAFIIGFPLLVAMFAWHGLPAVVNLSMGLDTDGYRQMTEAREFLKHSSKIGSLISGLVMFQVILLTLMGANNSGREIASERGIFEKERISGLSPVAYVASKAVFLFLLAGVQSLWMAFFVHKICGFPGSFPAQLGFLFLVNAAVTSICLAISALMRTPEQASLASIYLVGFQLPLSGAVLALPEPLGGFVRPLISAYWGWSGILQTLRTEDCYEIVQNVVQSPLAGPAMCLWILCVHIAVGLFGAWIGCERRRTG